MKIVITLIFFVSMKALSFGVFNDWIADTCEINGPVKYLVYKSKMFYSETNEMWEEYTYEYNQQRYMIRHNRSSSRSGNNYNAYFRVFDPSGKLCLIDYYLQSGDTASWTKYSYNEEGKVIKSVLYNWGKYWNTTTYSYNYQGLMTEYLCTIASGEKFPESFRYDLKGRLIYHEDISSTVKEMTYWSYDENGFLSEQKYLDSSRAPRTTHYIGKNGQEDSVVTQDNSKNPYTEDSYIYKFRYNDSGQLIEFIENDIQGNSVRKTTYTYNESGDISTEIMYSTNYDKTYTYTYKYEYDHYMNWTSKTTNLDGKLFREESQTITYY